MTQQEICTTLRGVYDKWTSYIKEEDIKKAILERSYIAGGAIASLSNDETPADYDVYFYDKESAYAVINYYITRLNKDKTPAYPATIGDDMVCAAGTVSFDDDTPWPYTIRSIVPGSVMLNGGVHRGSIIEVSTDHAINLIAKHWGEPNDVVDTFDFYHSMAWYVPSSDTVTLLYDTLNAIHDKQLRYNVNALYPMGALYRLPKFIKRGYNIDRVNLREIASAITKSNIKRNVRRIKNEQKAD
jgi:hypothetical protein